MRKLIVFTVLAITFNVHANLLGPNPFTDKKTFYPQLLSLFDKALVTSPIQQTNPSCLANYTASLRYQDGKFWLSHELSCLPCLVKFFDK